MQSTAQPIRLSTAKEEGILQVSKWIKVQILLDAEEMRALMHVLAPFFLVVVSEPVKADEMVVSTSAFLDKYAEYANALKQGQIPAATDYRRLFSCALATTLQSFYAIAAGGEKLLAKPSSPVLQMQAHHFFYSHLDGKFHPMVLSADSISWGVQFSYPQLCQDPKTHRILKIVDSEQFPNTGLFTKLMKWMRSFTLPTPFEVQGKRTNSPIRIGKKSLAWIKNHPQLQQKGIQIYTHIPA